MTGARDAGNEGYTRLSVYAAYIQPLVTDLLWSTNYGTNFAAAACLFERPKMKKNNTSDSAATRKFEKKFSYVGDNLIV